MPYAVHEGKDGCYEVINTETEEVKAEHMPPDAKEKAERQRDLLEEIEKDGSWEK